MPATVQGIIFVGAAVLLTLVGMALVRRLVTPRTLADHNDVAGFVYATTGVTYAVILAFVVIAVWEQYDDARRVADGEADAVWVLYRLANGFPEPVPAGHPAGDPRLRAGGRRGGVAGDGARAGARPAGVGRAGAPLRGLHPA